MENDLRSSPAHAIANRRKATFLERSASVASLFAWKARFESYAGKFAKAPTFVSYTEEEKEYHPQSKFFSYLSDEGYSTGPENDFPPEYNEVINAETPPPPHPEEEKKQEETHFRQDFTALENYFKKKLKLQKKRGSVGCSGNNVASTERVYQWLNELPEGDNLEEFLEAYGIPTKGVDLDELKGRLRMFLQERLQFDIERGHDFANETKQQEKSKTNSPRWNQQIADLKELSEGENLENWLESLDVPYCRPIPETKEEIKKYLRTQLTETTDKGLPEPPPKLKLEPEIPPEMRDLAASIAPQWKQLVEQMRTLKDKDELEKWLDGLEYPCDVPKDKVRAEIRKFFMHEEFEHFAGKSIILQEHTIAKKLWEKFEDTTVLNKVLMIGGATAALGLVAVLSSTMLSFTFPAALAFAVNPYFTEVFAQYFLQRQEIAFNLLSVHAQNAKPLSTAWAKQYVLWKYC